MRKNYYEAMKIINNFNENEKARWCFWVKDLLDEEKDREERYKIAKDFLENYKDSLDE